MGERRKGGFRSGSLYKFISTDWRKPELDRLLYINTQPLCPSREDTLSVKDSACKDAHIKTKSVQAVNIKYASIFLTAASADTAYHSLTPWRKLETDILLSE